MLDIGWQEFILVSFILLIVVGPKDLPKVLKNVTHFFRKIRHMASDFQHSVDEMANETELDQLRNEVKEIKNSKSLSSTKSEIENLKKINDDTKKFVKKNVTKIKK